MGGKSEHSDAKLFRQLMDEPQKALDAIYDRYGLSVIRYLRKFSVHDEETIKDITQDTFQVAWENREKVANLKSPLHWVLRVANNKAMDELRTRGKLPADPLEDHEGMSATERADSELEREEIKDAIFRATATLTTREREVFTEIMVNKKTNREVAEKDRVSVQTVKNLLGRGLKKLRQALADMGGAVLI